MCLSKSELCHNQSFEALWQYRRHRRYDDIRNPTEFCEVDMVTTKAFVEGEQALKRLPTSPFHKK